MKNEVDLKLGTNEKIEFRDYTDLPLNKDFQKWLSDYHNHYEMIDNSTLYYTESDVIRLLFEINPFLNNEIYKININQYGNRNN